MQLVAFSVTSGSGIAPPTNLTATAISGSQINLNWTASNSPGVTEYLIERCQGVGCTAFGRLFDVSSTTYSDTTLVPTASYTYQVRAVDSGGNFSNYSNQATAVTLSTISGLVAAYSFNEGAGTTTADQSGNGNTGTLANATWTSQGKYGSALLFNGSNSLVTIADSASLHLSSEMTLEAWVNPTNITNAMQDVIYKANDNYYLEGTTTNSSLPNGGGTFGTTDVGTYGTAALTASTWTHLAATYDGTTLSLYVNGVQVSSLPQTGAIASSTNPLQIGGDTNLGQFFAGTIDEVRVYNAALTSAQIQSDMNTPLGGSSSLPIVNLSTSSLSFGNQAIQTTSTAQSVKLTNVGAASLTINSITVSGGNATDFTQNNNCGSALAPNNSCTINVTFTPSTTGLRNSSIAITDNASGSPQAVALSGTGTTTGFAVTPGVSVITVTMTQQFSATGNVIWSVDGTVGGSSSSGTITTTGLYTPPNAAGIHTITATTSSQSGSATVYVTNYSGTFTYHNDTLRTGQNLSETVLAPTNVNPTQFGKLFSYTLDGLPMASPLYVPNVTIPGQGSHNVVYVATEHDSVYAFDANGLSGSPLWHASFLSPGVTTVPCSAIGCSDIPVEYGITSTPVIDPTTGTLYVVANTEEGSNYVQRLHALDITTGAEKFGGPAVIQAAVSGTGDGSQNNQLAFDPLFEDQRAALLLSNGVVYVAWGSHEDAPPWHGWVMGFSAGTLQLVMVYNASPNGNGAGIWQSGGGPAADASGNIYFSTGNGDFTANTGGVDYGDTVLKLSTSGTVLDYFTPHDQANMANFNLDLASAGPVLLLDQPGNNPHVLITAGKGGTIYVINRDNMGHFQSSSDNQIIQALVGALPNGNEESGNYSAPVFFNNSIYFSAVNDNIRSFQWGNGSLSGTPTSLAPETFSNRGGTMAISANGSTNGILWAMQDASPSNGVLHAYNASNLATELYNSSQAGSRDALDLAMKFNIPLVANGLVYACTQTQLVAYGLLP